MPYPKIKSENYSNVGGINEKASIYKTGENEVLGLVNFDFSEPGAWTKRWGFTNTLISGNTLTIGTSSTLNEMWQVFRNNLYDVTPPVTSPYLTFLFGHSQGVFKRTELIFPGITGASFIYSNLLTGFSSCNWNHTTYKTQTYFAAGGAASGQIWKYQPPYNTSTADLAYYFGMDIPPTALLAGLTATTTAGTSFSGTYSYQYAYQDIMGFYGPLSGTFTFSTAGANTIVISGFTLNNSASYGYASTALFRSRVTGFVSTDMVRIALFTGQTFTDQYGLIGQPNPDIIETPETTSAYTSVGKYFEIYQNRMFYTKDNMNTTDGNLVYFSELDQPQLVFPENNFSVTNGSNQLTGLKKFNQSLMIFLQKGFFRLTGDNPDNFNVQEITTEYGCISNKAIVEFKNRLWFLDESGIVEFNGANYDQIAQRMFDTFASMNIGAAYQTACAVHVPERNEVWFAIPTGTSTINNTVVVYDYLANGWTTFSGTKLKPTALAAMHRVVSFENDTVNGNRVPKDLQYFFGSIGASLYNFHPSLTSDDGSGITLSFQTRWHTDLGKSATSQFRRFFLDTKIANGATQTFGQTFGLSFYANYASTTISLTRAFNTSTLTENWIDFGIPAKSLSVNTAYGSTVGTVKVYGYTVESRYQRNK